jgi:ArsR family transcriptional regulator, arsenate/arsenite/antimonite-responsive transcriptional repressor
MKQRGSEQVTRYADIFAALGAEPRLRIIRVLLSAHPEGMIVNEIQAELQITGSTLSHHLDKLRNEDLVTVTRESTCLRYRANAEVLQELLTFLFAECCKKSACVPAEQIFKLCR